MLETLVHHMIVCLCILLSQEDNRFKVGGHDARRELGISEQDESQLVDPRILSSTNWKLVFLQTKEHRRNLTCGTKFLYCEILPWFLFLGWLLIFPNNSGRPFLRKMPSSFIKVCKVDDTSHVVDVMRERKVSASLGCGYHEFVSPQFISPTTKVLLEDEVSHAPSSLRYIKC